MDHVCVVLPILPGMTDEARAFQRDLETTRRAEYDRSERRLGIAEEHWFLAALPSGDQLVAYLESEDFDRAFRRFVQSSDGFDRWFKHRLADVTGIDFSNPPPGLRLPELVSSFQA